MIYVYYSYWGSYAAVIAAGLHLKKISPVRFPTEDAFYNLPFFGRISYLDLGLLKFAGIDDKGNKVYVMGCRKAAEVIKNAFRGMQKIFQQPEQLIMINTDLLNNLFFKLGAWLSCRWQIRKIGGLLLTWGIRKGFSQMVSVLKDSRYER